MGEILSCEEFELTKTDQTFDERIFDDCRTKSDSMVESGMIQAEFFSKTSRNESVDPNTLLSVQSPMMMMIVCSSIL